MHQTTHIPLPIDKLLVELHCVSVIGRSCFSPLFKIFEGGVNLEQGLGINMKKN